MKKKPARVGRARATNKSRPANPGGNPAPRVDEVLPIVGPGARLRMALSAARMVAWEYDPATKALITSENAPDVLGFPTGHVLGYSERGFAMLHPDDVDRHRALVDAALAAGTEFLSQFRIIRPDTGAVQWMEERGHAVRDAARGSVRLVGVTMDITAQKHAELALRESEERAAFVRRSSGVGFWYCDLPFDVLQWDELVKEHFHLPPNAPVTIQTFYDRIHPDDREPTRQAIQASIAGRSEYHVDYRTVHPTTGAVKWVRAIGRTSYAADGTPTRFDGVTLDVTAHKRAEAELREREARMRLATQATAVGIWQWNVQTRQIRWDDQMFFIYGLTPTPTGLVDYRVWSDAVLPQDLPAQEALLHQTIRTRGQNSREFRIRRASDGQTRILQAVETVRTNDAGEVQWVVGTNLDITDQRRAEESLREARQRLESMLRSIDDGLIVMDRDWRYTYFSERAAKIVGVQPEDMLGGSVWELFPHAEGTKFHAEFHRAVDTGEPTHFEEFYPEPINKWLDCHCYPSAEGLTVYFRDATERKEQEAERHALHQTLEVLIDRCPFGIYIVDADFTLVNVNAGTRAGAFRNVRPLIGRPFDEVIRTIWPQPVAAEVLEKFRHTLHTGEPYRSRDFVRQRADTEELEGYEWELHRLTLPDGRPGVVCYYYDATQLRQVEQALRDAHQRKDEFLATLAHELRNPLAPIRNALQVMRLARLSGTAEQARQMMERQLTSLVRLVDDLLDVNRVTSGKLDLRREHLQIKSVIDAAVETSSPLIDSARHHLVVSVPDEPILVHGDPTRLAQVVSNLINNSAKYTHPGGHIRLSVRREEGSAVIAVADNGIGIPPAMLDQIFDMFTQVDRTLEKTTGGLGIGLSLAKGLVEMHGGTIQAHSPGEGLGSEFLVRLPVLAGPPGATPADRAPPAQPSRRLRILIADDNADSADSLANLLGLLGHDVCVANDGLRAVELADTFRPDVILLDIAMPKLNGHDACRRIRAQAWAARTTIIALTGWGQDEDRRRSFETGFDHHIVKPLDPAALEALLAERPDPQA